jgi:ABC-2 type transport system ATP-binding protein
VFVTHDAETVRRVCDRAVVLHRGDAVFDGDPAHAIRVLREQLHVVQEHAPGEPSRDRTISSVRVRHAHQHQRAHLLPGEAVTLEVDLVPFQPIAKAVLDLEVGDRLGRSIYRVDTDGLSAPLGRVDRARTVRFVIRNVWLLDGEFPISLRLSDQASGQIIDWRDSVASFEVEAPGRADGTVALDVSVE